MKIKEQISIISSNLQVWLDGIGTGNGTSFVASDLTHLWKLLSNGPKTLKCITMYQGEEIREVIPGAAILGRVDRKFMTLVSRGRSLNIDRGATLTEDTQAGEPLFDLVEDARDIIRATLFNPQSTERPIDYERVIQFPTEGSGMIIDAYQIEYTVGTQLQMIVNTPAQLAAP